MDPLDPDLQPPQLLQRMPSWQLAQAAAIADSLVSARLAEAGLRKHHYSTLLTLSDAGPLSQAAIGRRLGIDRSHLHALVAALDQAGLIERERHRDDRRRNEVRLSAHGRQTLERLTSAILEAQEVLLAPLDTSEREALGRLLDRIREAAREESEPAP